MKEEFSKQIHGHLTDIVNDVEKVRVAFTAENAKIMADLELKPFVDADTLENALCDISNKLFDLHNQLLGKK